jgi:hypothetical protein
VGKVFEIAKSTRGQREEGGRRKEEEGRRKKGDMGRGTWGGKWVSKVLCEHVCFYRYRQCRRVRRMPILLLLLLFLLLLFLPHPGC